MEEAAGLLSQALFYAECVAAIVFLRSAPIEPHAPNRPPALARPLREARDTAILQLFIYIFAIPPAKIVNMLLAAPSLLPPLLTSSSL